MARKKSGTSGAGRDRAVPKKLKKQIIERLAPGSPIGYSPEFDVTVDELDAGKTPSQTTLEKRFPGITASPLARKEFIMLSIFTLRLRGHKMQSIANSLGISLSSVGWYVKQMQKCFEKEILALSFTGQVGRSVAVFRELQAKAGQIMDKPVATVNNQLRAIREMAYMEHSIIGTLQKGGFFANARLNPQHSQNAPQTELGSMQAMLDSLFSGGDAPDEDIAPEDDTPENYVADENDVTVLRIS